MQVQDALYPADGAKTSCVVKIAGLAQAVSLRVRHVKQSLFHHHIHKTGVSAPCLPWQLRSAAGSHVTVLCLEVQGVPVPHPPP